MISYYLLSVWVGVGEYSVTLALFFTEGLWKCRHCEWTYCLGSPLSDLYLNLNEKEPSFSFETNKVTKSVDEDFEIKNPSSTFETNNSGDADVDNIMASEKDESLLSQVNECRNKVSNGLSDSILTALNHGFEEQTMESNSFNNGTRVVGDFNSIEEVDQGDADEFDVEKVLEKQSKSLNYGTTVVVGDFNSIEEVGQGDADEFDVKKVLEKQNTHDLYCPNCNSCITRRVVLRRKRKIRNVRRTTKYYNKVEANSPSLDAVSTNGFNGQVHEIQPSDRHPALAADNQNSGREPEIYINSSDSPPPALAADREPEVFRCLACFSIFMPTGNGFKLFWPFGDSNNKNVQEDLQKTPARNSNWLSSVFRADKNKIPVEQGNETEPNQHGLLASTAPPSLGLVSDVGRVLEQAREEIDISSTQDNKNLENVSTGMREKLDTATVKAETDGATSSYLITSSVEKENKKADQAEPLTGVTVEEASTQGGTNSPPLSSTWRGTPIPKEETTEGTSNKEATFISMESKNTGNDVVVIIQRSSETQISQGSDGSTEVVSTSSVLQTRTPACTREDVGVTSDILKSIVYGGLIECITSLGVVSSAAGAGSTTLNILALGLANLIGGLFIIGHNLVELKKDTSSNRYEATLGQRGKFTLHATVAIISFLIFGMLSPVIYGFSFRKSDDKDLKVAVVGGASLLCIFLLAMGKAYVRRPPKAYISTVLYYVIIGIMASGVSYVVGDLISKLMERLGWFGGDSTLAVPFTLPPTKPIIQLQWHSY